MHVVALPVAALVLAGCTSWFGTDEDPPLPGDRVSVLTLEERLVPADETADPVVLAEPVTAAWPQPDANTDNRPPHAAYSGALAVAWDLSLGSAESRTSRMLGQPVIGDGRLYFLDADGQVFALSLENRRTAWTRSIRPQGEDGGRAVGGGVALDGGTLFVTTAYGDVLALDAATGNAQWQRSYGIPFRAAPTVQGARVYAGLLTDQTVALQRTDGSEIWLHDGAFKQGPSLLNALPAAANDDVVIAPYSTGEIVALRADNGREAWRVPLVEVFRGAAQIEIEDVAGGPVIDAGSVIAGGATGLLGSFDLQTGASQWRVPLSVAHTPRVTGDWLYALTADGEAVCLRRSTGNVRWRTNLAEVLGIDDDDELSWSGLIVAGGTVIVAGSQRLVSLDPSDGSVVRTAALRGDPASAPIAAGGTLYVLTREGAVVALN
jgi:outer membrane protein assembly factor BamB